MAQQIEFQFDIVPTDVLNPVGFEVLCDGEVKAFCWRCTETERVKISLDDLQEAEHEVRIVMDGKTWEHTKIGEDGEILQDSMLQICRIFIDGIDITQVVEMLATYTHDGNGSEPLAQHSFHGFMGCNGCVSFRFSTPYYLWLLENM